MDSRIESGNPGPAKISTGHVERNHPTMRMGIRGLTRLTNCFSKRAENLRAAVALHFAYYNFVRRHGSVKTAPTVAAGLVEKPWTVSERMEGSDVCGRQEKKNPGVHAPLGNQTASHRGG